MLKLRHLPWLLLFLTGLARAAEIQVSVDRNQVGLNESFRITFTSQQQPDANPDFTPLEENFDILNRQQGSTSSWVNGQGSRQFQWILQLMAKQSGELLIPPIAFGSDASKPLTIKVADQAQAQSNDDLYLDVEATPQQAYVQSQVLYTVKLFRRVQVAQATLTEPEVKDAVIEKLVEDNTYTRIINGSEYTVTERKYAIFPQQSGTITIAPLTLVGQVQRNDPQAGIYGFFNRYGLETRRISSKAISLNILPAPQGASGNWISAESLQLSDNWSDNSLQVKVGEPLTRTLTVTASASTVGQLPELAGTVNIHGIKSYPDQPQLREEKSSDGLIAVRQEKIAYIPTSPGEFTLPAIRIDWFNSKSGKMQSSELPEIKITALGAAADTGAGPTPTGEETASARSDTASVKSERVVDDSHTFWPWLSALLATGWLLNLLWFYRRGWQSTAKSHNLDLVADKTPTLNIDKTLREACNRNDANAARQALLEWAKSGFACHNLTALAAQCPPPLAREILSLNQTLYAEETSSWNGMALWQAFVDNRLVKAVEKLPAKSESALQPLYKL